MPLKAVTHPQLKTRAYHHRAANPLSGGLAAGGEELSSFNFYYVLDIATDRKDNVWLLLSYDPEVVRRSLLGNLDGPQRANFAELAVGWAEIKTLTPWCTREGMEFNMTPAALALRRSNVTPIRLTIAEVSPADPRSNTDPKNVIVQEHFDDPRWSIPMKPNEMRFMILDRLRDPIPVEGVTANQYRLCLNVTGGDVALRGKDAPGAIRSTNESFAKWKRAAEDLRVLELVVLLDVTGSMDPAQPALKEAIGRLFTKLQEKEQSQDLSLRLHIHATVVAYRDFPDKSSDPPILEPAGRFFDLENEKDLKELQTFVMKLHCVGGGDPPEQPFVGLKEAVDHYLGDHPGSFHHPGAATTVLVIGDAPNCLLIGETIPGLENKPGSPKVEDALEWLKPDAEKSKVTDDYVGRISFNAAYSKVGHADETIALLLRWDEQMGLLSRRTGGESVHLDFTKSTPPEEHARQLFELIDKIVERRRALILKQLEKPPIHHEDALDRELLSRLKEVMLPEDVERLQQDMQAVAPVIVYGLDRDKGETENDKTLRLQGRVLLQFREITDLLATGNAIVKGIDGIEIDPNWTKEQADQKIREGLISVLASALGEGSHTKNFAKVPLSQLQEQIGALPITFGILDKFLKKGENMIIAPGDLTKVSDDMKKSLEVLAHLIKEEDRWFSVGARGVVQDTYIWVKSEELP